MKILDMAGVERTESTDDLTALGTLTPDTIRTICHPADPGTPETGHYETTREYPTTGGREVIWVVDDPGTPPTAEWWETEDILRFIPYADAELARRRVEELTMKLRATDADVLDALEGLLAATSPADLLTAIAEAAGSLTETLAARRDLRERIAKLKEE